MQPRAARFSFESKKRNHVGLVDLDVRHTTASLGCSCSWFNVAFAKDPFKVGKVKERLVITLPYNRIWHKTLSVACTVWQFEYFRVFGNVRREDGLTWLLNILLWP